MAYTPKTTAERFAALVDEFLDDPTVTPPSNGRRFGSTGLKVNGRIVAMLSQGRLVVRLPRARVEALVQSGDADRYDPRRDGRLMKEWAWLDPTSDQDWPALAREAREFVAAIESPGR